MLVLLLLAILVPERFLTVDNLLNVFRRSSVNVIMAVGMTAIIISGGVDLSVGSMLALAGMVGAWTMQTVGGEVLTAGSMWLGTLAGVATGLLAGLLNGVLINSLKLPPFILTLGTMSIFRGITYLLNRAQSLNVAGYTYLGQGDCFTIPASVLTRGQALPVPVSVLLAVAIAGMAAAVLRHTKLGRYTYAIGTNRLATLYSGVNVNRVLILVYALAGLLVGVAAMIATSRTVSAQPTAGVALELDIIAAVVIGGASLNGGRGTILGTVIGALLISFLRNGCVLLQINDHIQLIVIGAIIVVAVTVDQTARAQAK